MIKTKKQMYTVIGAFILVMLLTTVTYAFFNYTRTGEANTIRVGRIAFNTTQASGQDGAINLSNAFPITRTLAATDNTNTGEVVITITGDTSYVGGVEYLVTATDVSNTVNSKTVPISIIATASSGLGTEDEDYFTHRGTNAASSIYKVLASETVSENDELLVGYIKSDEAAINGTLTIRAYLDSDLVAISDTYNDGNTPTDNLGTPASFGNGRTVLTTSEWNGLRTNGISFKVKIEAEEGTWVENPNLAWKVISRVAGLEDVAGAKRYVGATPNNYVMFNNQQWRIIGVYGDQLKIIKATPLTKRVYNNSTDDGNVWEGSALETYLNQETEGGYYYDLTPTAKAMIVTGTWNAGATAHNVDAATAYNSAQTTQVLNKKIGLIAGYEYLYAAGNECREAIANIICAANLSCGTGNWLTPTSASAVTLSPFSLDSAYVLTMTMYCGGLGVNSVTANNAVILPVVYLNSNVTITGGTGESGGNEYILNYLDN